MYIDNNMIFCVSDAPCTMEAALSFHHYPLSNIHHVEANDNYCTSLPPFVVQTDSNSHGASFQEGFVDGACEAIRFLTEEEGLAEDSSLVSGLKQHLEQFTLPNPVTLEHLACSDMTPLASSNKLNVNPTVAVSRTIYSGSGNVRYSPYPITSCPRSQRAAITSCLENKPASVERMKSCDLSASRSSPDNVISTEDFGGVLRCLRSALPCSEGPQPRLPQAVRGTSCHILPTASTINLHDSLFCAHRPPARHTFHCTSLDANLDDSGYSDAVLTNIDSYGSNCDPTVTCNVTLTKNEYNEASDLIRLSEATSASTPYTCSPPLPDLSVLSDIYSSLEVNNVTAGRILDLTSEILLLLQEESEENADEDGEENINEADMEDVSVLDSDDECFDVEP